MSRTLAVHVRNKSLYISLPSSAKQREMAEFCVLWRTWTTTANLSFFHLELNAVIAYLARACFQSHFCTELISRQLRTSFSISSLASQKRSSAYERNGSFFVFSFGIESGVAYLAWASPETNISVTEQIWPIAKFKSKISSFFNRRCPRTSRRRLLRLKPVFH